VAFSGSVNDAITNASARYGVDPAMMRAFARIESGGNPGSRTGSYKGLFQLSDSEYSRNGGTPGQIYDATSNANAAALKLKAESADFENTYGRPPTASELYMVHQQGTAGAAAHMANPDAPAWQNMYSTGEGQQKGEGWAKKAIWGNIPDADKEKFGSVDNVSSKDFTDMWAQRVARAGGGDAPPSAPPGDTMSEFTTPTDLTNKTAQLPAGQQPDQSSEFTTPGDLAAPAIPQPQPSPSPQMLAQAVNPASSPPQAASAANEKWAADAGKSLAEALGARPAPTQSTLDSMGYQELLKDLWNQPGNKMTLNQAPGYQWFGTGQQQGMPARKPLPTLAQLSPGSQPQQG